MILQNEYELAYTHCINIFLSLIKKISATSSSETTHSINKPWTKTPELSELRRQTRRWSEELKTIRQSLEKTIKFVFRDDGEQRPLSKTWTWDPCSHVWITFASEEAKVLAINLPVQRRTVNFWDTQSHISGFNMRAFPLLAEESLNVWQQGKTSVSLNMLYQYADSHSNSNCMNSSFQVNVMLSELTVGFIFIDEIEPCRFEIQNLPSQVPWSFKSDSAFNLQYWSIRLKSPPTPFFYFITLF